MGNGRQRLCAKASQASIDERFDLLYLMGAHQDCVYLVHLTQSKLMCCVGENQLELRHKQSDSRNLLADEGPEIRSIQRKKLPTLSAANIT